MATKKELQYLEAKDAYYKGEPIMTDSEFDELERELKYEGSPVVEIVGKPGGKSLKYQHHSKMLSLDKIKLDEEDFKAKLGRFLERAAVPHVRIMPKFDGNAINVIYENGQLVAGITRGNGQYGVNVTNKIRRAVPNRIDVEDRVEIRGETLIDLPRFQKDFSEEFKNARNFVAGVLNKDNNDVTTLNSLKFLPLDVRIHTDEGILYSFEEHPEVKEKYDGEIEYLEDEGFTIPPGIKELNLDFNADSFDSLMGILSEICDIRDDYEKHEFPYLLDGAVIRFSDPEVRRSLGEGNHSPDWAMAVKLPAVEKSTIIKRIEWSVGNTGNLIPVAILNPVEVDGSVISRVTLHNYGWMRDRKCYPGAVVKIIKSGDIIPKVVEVLKEGKYLDLEMQCPECDGQLVIDDIHLKCTNNNCKAVAVKNLENSFNALEFDYLGRSTCESLYDAGVYSVLDFLEPGMCAEKLTETGVFKDGRFLERMMSQYGKLRDIPLHRLVLALNFEKVGGTIAKKIAKTYSGHNVDWSGIDSSVVERFASGYTAEIDNTDAFSEEYRMLNKIIGYVRERGFDIKFPEIKKNAVKYEMTKSPKKHGFKTKGEFKKVVGELGGEHVSLSKADYLITDDLESNSSKMKKARKKGIEVITYGDFYKMLEG